MGGETQPVRSDGFFLEALGRPAVFTYRVDTYRVYRGYIEGAYRVHRGYIQGA